MPPLYNMMLSMIKYPISELTLNNTANESLSYRFQPSLLMISGMLIDDRDGFPEDDLEVRDARGKVPEATHLCQKPLDQAGCKSRDVHERQGPEGESQQANPQDRLPQYFSKNLSHTKIEPALPEDFSPRHLKSY
ncbi:Uncharacterized protein Fot_55470 [Forsythia ovata]|uniref:Uncharacterized protein n=1 Tax=Forsythia ovata TaxID=205694 RepID=A0ABD1P4V8_9LAMI